MGRKGKQVPKKEEKKKKGKKEDKKKEPEREPDGDDEEENIKARGAHRVALGLRRVAERVQRADT